MIVYSAYNVLMCGDDDSNNENSSSNINGNSNK
jgi:hypothetical protein